MREYTLLNGATVYAYSDYNEAKSEADRKSLTLAEYGDVYGSDVSYAYWNASGNRNDDEEIIAYYRFGETGKPEPIGDEELDRRLFN